MSGTNYTNIAENVTWYAWKIGGETKSGAKQSSVATTLIRLKTWFSANKQKKTNRSRRIEDKNKSIPSLW